MIRNKTFYEVATFYKNKKQPVHITLNSGTWFNGIINFLERDRLVLDDEKVGEVLILFDRIKDDGIEPREERR